VRGLLDTSLIEEEGLVGDLQSLEQSAMILAYPAITFSIPTGNNCFEEL